MKRPNNKMKRRKKIEDTGRHTYISNNSIEPGKKKKRRERERGGGGGEEEGGEWV